MEAWQVGLVIMMTVGVAVILFGALWDRERNRRRAEQITRPPDRAIPGLEGTDPAYVITHPPHGHRPLADAERAALEVRLPAAPVFNARLAAQELVSDPDTGWAVVEHARVLVCGESVHTLREILTVLDRAAGTGTPLVIVAPSFDRETLTTLIVNHLHRTVQLVAATAEPAVLAEIAEAAGATLITRIDLQSGWVPDEHLGTVALWVSTTKNSRLLRPAG